MSKRYLLALLCCVMFIPAPIVSARTLRVARSVDAKILDPHLTLDTGSGAYMLEIYETLLALDSEKNFVPRLAEKWEQLDERTWKFTLRQGVMFHNGEELTADDVIFSLKRSMTPQAAAVKAYSDMIDPQGLSAEDRYTLIVKTKEVFTPFLLTLQTSFGFILNRKAVEQAGEDYGRTTAIGTGPFKLASWKRADRMEFERFDDYWDNQPLFERMVIRVVPEATSRTIELETASVDIAGDLPINEALRLEQENKNLQIIYSPNTAINYLGFNTQSEGPLGDKRVRNAIDLALDKEAILDAVLKGKGQIPGGPIPYFCRYYPDEPARQHNMEEAQRLLKEAGYEKGFAMKLWTNDSKTRMDMATIIQAQLDELNISVDIQILEWGTFLEALKGDGVEAFLIGTATAAPDPFFALNASFDSRYAGSTNRSRLSDPVIDALLHKGMTTPEGPQRTAIYKELWDALNDQRPWACISLAYVIIGMKEEFTNTQGIETRTDLRYGLLNTKEK